MIVLDYNQTLFGNSRWWRGMEDGGCPYSLDQTNQKLTHVDYGSQPPFVHVAAGFVECFNSLATSIGLEAPLVSEFSGVGSESVDSLSSMVRSLAHNQYCNYHYGHGPNRQYGCTETTYVNHNHAILLPPIEEFHDIPEFGKSWNLRWFVLHPGGILTYSHSKGGKEDKRILLCPATQVRPLTHPESTAEAKAHSSKKPFAFEIFQGPGVRTWYLDGGSSEKLDVWLRCLSEAIGQVRMSAACGMPRVV